MRKLENEGISKWSVRLYQRNEAVPQKLNKFETKSRLRLVNQRRELQEKRQRRELTLPKFETLAKFEMKKRCVGDCQEDSEDIGGVRKRVERGFDEKRL